MSIRLKFVFIVLPLLIVALVVGGVSSFYLASNGITRVAVEFFEFKVNEFEKYIEGQWTLLVENNLDGRADMMEAVQAGIEVYARSILRTDSEVIFAVDSQAEGNLVLSTADSSLSDPEQPFAIGEEVSQQLLNLATLDSRELIELEIDGQERVTMGFYFKPFAWYVIITENRAVFYSDVNRITTQTILLVVIGSAVMVVLLLIFVGLITKPLTVVVDAMRKVIQDNDLSTKVPVKFNDEIGQMTNTFNIMTAELESAYEGIKKYAFEAAVSEKKESKVRHMFQKYVPQELIDQFFASPESMLVGQNRELSVLFSDIRSFTSISERMDPEDLVNNLNRYFQYMVDIIYNRNGIIDKYIGDAIMAFFGAPVHHDDDALQSVLTGIQMIDAVEIFNKEQQGMGKPDFNIGVGINYGEVTVGNIGTDKKLDYTVIGDTVNVASRLEGLTKQFKQPILIAENLQKHVESDVLWRTVATVAVKGKQEGLKIYTVAKKDSPEKKKILWNKHNEAMELFYSRNFLEAKKLFGQLSDNHPDDFLSNRMTGICSEYKKSPPEGDWNGVEIMTEK